MIDFVSTSTLLKQYYNFKRSNYVKSSFFKARYEAWVLAFKRKPLILLISTAISLMSFGVINRIFNN